MIPKHCTRLEGIPVYYYQLIRKEHSVTSRKDEFPSAFFGSKKFVHSSGGIGAKGESEAWLGTKGAHLISQVRAKPRCLLLQDKSQGGEDDDHLNIWNVTI